MSIPIAFISLIDKNRQWVLAAHTEGGINELYELLPSFMKKLVKIKGRYFYEENTGPYHLN